MHNPTDRHRYRYLTEYFDRQAINEGFTSAGYFAPSSITILDDTVQALERKGKVDLSLPFIDSGCGRGDALAYWQATRGAYAVGIEHDPDRFQESADNIAALAQAGIVDLEKTSLINGDSTKLQTFTQNGIDLEQPWIVFNYLDNLPDVADALRAFFPKGTYLLLYKDLKTISHLAGFRYLDHAVGHATEIKPAKDELKDEFRIRFPRRLHRTAILTAYELM